MFNFLASRLHAATTQGKDRGAAVVAAIGVMIICLALGALVISQAIAAQEDSGRNRARTVEIHNAEGGVDTLYAKLQHGEFVCDWQTTSGDELGPDSVGAHAELRYWNESGAEMECSGEELSVDANNMPARAKILVTSEAGRSTGSGIQPKRSFESEVVLKKNDASQHGAAIFSARAFSPSNSTTVKGEGADVWVDHGDYNCSNHTMVSGSVFTPEGGVVMSNGCRADGDVNSSQSIFLHNDSKIDGDVNSKSGDLRTQSTQSLVGGSAKLGGTWADRTGEVKGSVKEGYEFGGFYQSQGLPSVTYRPSDWEGFNELSKEQFADTALSGLEWYGNEPNACGSEWYGGVVSSPSEASIVNLSPAESPACEINLREVTIELNADLAMFADQFTASNNVEFKSADGEEHKLWLIVPEDKQGLPGDKTGGIHLSNQTRFSENAPVFLFAQGQVTLTNSTDFYGQVYGDPVDSSNDTTFTYREMGIPGVDLMPGYVDLDGEWDVDVVYKRETGDRVN